HFSMLKRKDDDKFLYYLAEKTNFLTTFVKKKENMERRLPAEWEPQSGVQLTFPHANTDWSDDLEEVVDCFRQIAREISMREKLLVVAEDRLLAEEALDDCRQENLIITSLPTNDTWARDHAPITIFENNQPKLLDFVFNGWGLKFAADKDNQISRRLYMNRIFGNISLEAFNFVLEGGSIESDGQGTLLTTAECLLSHNRNYPLTVGEIEERLKAYLGVRRILWLHFGSLLGDDTDAHIDTLARFCNPQTIAYVKCYDKNDPHYDGLRRMEEELQQFKQADGKPYHLVALPLPSAIYDQSGYRLPATYANFLIINGAVLVPIYQVSEDKEAITLLRKCFPDREIIPIDCRVLIRQHGSLHCITMQYPLGVL
ncbi:MAG: agmatine deiminase family protein, partial [Flammeovirgaceae bacterium]|nr:agmatine deiminase family protein [Flammeovirgaceae bacterium]